MIAFKCRACGVALRATDDKAGKSGKCPKCGGVIVIPGPVQAQHVPVVPGQRAQTDNSAHALVPMPSATIPADSPSRKNRLPAVLAVSGGVVLLATAGFFALFMGGPGKNHPTEPTGPTWQHDWGEFGELLISLTQTEASIEKVTESLNALLTDREVEWSGTVEEIVPPGRNPNPTLVVGMEQLRVAVAGQEVADIDRLSLSPTDEEWKAWASIVVGAKVVFRTRLVKKDLFGKDAVVLFLRFSGQMVSGPETGKPINAVWIVVNTSGAELVSARSP